MRLHLLRNHLDDRCAGEHPGLGWGDIDILKARVDLAPDELKRQVVYALYTDRILGRNRRDHRRPEDTKGRKGFQIGLNPRSTPGIRSRDGQRRPHRSLTSVVTTRSEERR